VVIGGVGTLGVIALWAWLFPELRGADGFINQPAAAAEQLS